MQHIIKFKIGDLSYLRSSLLKDLSREHFAVLLAKSEQIDGITFLKVIDIRLLKASDYEGQSLYNVRPKKEFILQRLLELQERFDIDTIIDVHTHPFSTKTVHFSGVDDADEIGLKLSNKN